MSPSGDEKFRCQCSTIAVGSPWGGTKEVLLNLADPRSVQLALECNFQRVQKAPTRLKLSCKGAPMAPRRLQNAPKTLHMVPKMGPSLPKLASRGAQERPKWAQEAPKSSQVWPKNVQVRPKRRPRGSK